MVAGDLARLEEDGSITLLGRGSACINSGGEKIFPEEVESVLKTHPSIYDVLVVGVPDPRWGSAVCAVVQARPGATAPTLEELADHARAHLASYKLPRRGRSFSQRQARLPLGHAAGQGRRSRDLIRYR